MGAGEEAGDYVAEHHRLLDPLEEQSHHCAQEQDKRQIGNQTVEIGGGVE